MSRTLLNGISFKDDRMKDILCSAFYELVGYRKADPQRWIQKGRKFIKHFHKYTLEELSWSVIRSEYKTIRQYSSDYSKLFLLLFVILFRNGFLVGNEEKEVKRLYHKFMDLIQSEKKKVAPVFDSEDLAKMYFCDTNDGYYTICYVDAEPQIVDFALEIITDHDDNERRYKCGFFRNFNQSLLPFKCNEIVDLNGRTFWTQVQYYKEGHHTNQELKGYLFWVIHFYRKIAEKIENHRLYDSFLSRNVLFNAQLMSFIINQERIDLEKLILVPSKYSPEQVGILFHAFRNIIIKDTILPFVNRNSSFGSHLILSDVLTNFEDSLGDYLPTIHSFQDFNENTFFEQVRFYFKKKSSIKKAGITFTVNYYRYLIKEYIGNAFFLNSVRLNGEWFFSGSLLRYLFQGYLSIKYSPLSPMEYNTKTVFLLEDFDYVSSRQYDTHHIVLDLSTVKYDLYRRLLFHYYTESPENLLLSKGKGLLINVLNEIYKLKNGEGYPYPSYLDFYPEEARYICTIEQEHYEKAGKNGFNGLTFNNNMARIVAFFKWIISSKEARIHKENTFLRRLERVEMIKGNDARPIPIDELRSILFEMEKNASFNKLYMMYLIATRVILHTGIRASNVLNTTKSTLEESVIPGKFQLNYKKSKVSGLDRDTFPISKYVYKQIVKAISIGEEIRNTCYSPFKEQYVFIYENSFNCCHPILLSSINGYIEEVCATIGIRRYNVSNIRDTHMTKALLHELENDGNLQHLHVLTRHSSISTTYGYIPSQVDELLEVLYDVKIERDNHTMAYNPSHNIENQIPPGVNSDSTLVSQGCGHCKGDASKCLQPFPCVLCSDFVTCPSFEPMFEAEVRRYGVLISRTPCEEERLRLSYIQQVYAIYLRDIMLIKKNND